MTDPAENITERMQHVRKNVGEDVKGIVENARTLTDWRYYVRHHPWLCVGGALALGFLVVPKRKQVVTGDAKELLELLRNGSVRLAPNGVAANRGLVMTLLATAAPAVLRGAVALATQKLGAMAPPAADPQHEQPHMSAP